MAAPIDRGHYRHECIVRVALVNLTSGGLSGGYRKYLQQLVPRLAVHPKISQLEILSPYGVKFDRSQFATYWEWPSTDRLIGFRSLKRRLQHLKPDVVFIPTARIVSSECPIVVMVRNMEPLVAPFSGNSTSESVRNLARRTTARRSCRRATRIIAVSSFVRDFLVQRWEIPNSRIAVVAHGVEPPLGESQMTRPPLRSKDPAEPWFFAAGSIRPARGLEDAIDAVAILRDRNIAGSLIIAGEGNKHYFRTLTDRVADRAVQDRITWVGELSAPQMAWCYARCAAFLMTSRVEACPNTALEALSYGAPCISTTEPPMPEFFGPDAAYYQAGDGKLLATKIQHVLGMGSIARSQLSVSNQSRVAEMSWDKTTDATVTQLCIAADIRPRAL